MKWNFKGRKGNVEGWRIFENFVEIFGFFEIPRKAPNYEKRKFAEQYDISRVPLIKTTGD